MIILGLIMSWTTLLSTRPPPPPNTHTHTHTRNDQAMFPGARGATCVKSVFERCMEDVEPLRRDARRII